MPLLTRCLCRQYDLSVSTFSPDGRVFQTDYAQKAVDSGGFGPELAAVLNPDLLDRWCGASAEWCCHRACFETQLSLCRTVVGLKCKDGVVLVRFLAACMFRFATQLTGLSPELAYVQGCEKTVISKMLEEGSNKRTFAVDRHAGLVGSVQCSHYPATSGKLGFLPK